MGSIGSLLGGIGDTIGHLFGAGSSDRQVQRGYNNAGDALTHEGNLLDTQAGTLGNVGQDIRNSEQYLGNQAGSANAMGGQLARQSGALRQQGDALSQLRSLIGNITGAAGNVAGTAGRYTGAFNSAFPGSLESLLSESGLNPNGTVNESFDPYGLGRGDSLVNQYSDKVAPQYENAIASANKDLMGRGFTGANSLGQSEIGDIRRTQAQDVANFGRGVGLQAAQEKYGRMGNAINTVLGLGTTGAGLWGQAGSGYGAGANEAGNLASGYGSNAQGYGNTAAGYGAQGNAWGDVGRGWGNIGSLWENLAGAYGNTAGGWGNIANSYNNQAQNAISQGNQQTQNAMSTAQLLGLFL